jgi:hypothetical protein
VLLVFFFIVADRASSVFFFAWQAKAKAKADLSHAHGHFRWLWLSYSVVRVVVHFLTLRGMKSCYDPGLALLVCGIYV